MKISGEQVLPANREAVWQLFNDPDRLSRLIPGCEKLETVAPDEYSGTISMGVAAVKGVYNGKLRLEDKRPPEHYKIVIDGKGKQGFARGSGTIDLVADSPQQTRIKYAGDMMLGGPLMQVGQRMIDSAAKLMLGQFFAAAEAELKAQASGKSARQGLLINFIRYIKRAIRNLSARRSSG